MNNMNKTTKKYADLLDKPTIDEKTIVYMRKHINDPATPCEDKWLLIDKVRVKQPLLTDAQHRKGQAYLLNLQQTPTGKIRRYAPFNRLQFDTIANATHHKLMALDTGNDNAFAERLGYMHTLPVYGAYAGNDVVTYLGKAMADGRDFVDMAYEF